MNKEYLSVKEFAEAAEISQQAVYKQLNGRLKPFIKSKGKKKLIAAAALEEFYSIDDSENSTQVEKVEQPNSTLKNQDIQPKVEEVEQLDSTEKTDDKRQQLLEDQIKELQRQIQEILKNEQEEKQFLRDQIKQKDKQIESLTDNLMIAQQLAAADKKKLLEIEAKQQEIVEAEDHNVNTMEDPESEDLKKNPDHKSEKKGFFTRFFRR